MVTLTKHVFKMLQSNFKFHDMTLLHCTANSFT